MAEAPGIVYFKNSHKRDFVALYGSGAFFGLDTSGRQGTKARNLRPGQTCVVAERVSANQVTFHWYSLTRETLLANEDGGQDRVFFGTFLASETLAKRSAAGCEHYSVLFKDNGNFKDGSVFHKVVPVGFLPAGIHASQDAAMTDAFMQAIIESPDDDTPRLVFADFLDEHDEAERAELIRLQCRLHSLPLGSLEFGPILKRLKSLVPARLDHFLRPLTRLGLQFGEQTIRGEGFIPGSTTFHCQAVFRRGFMEKITLPGRENIRTFARHAEAVFRLAPLRHLEVTDVRGETEATDQGYPISYWLPDVDFVKDEDLRVLVQRPEMARLRTLLLRLDLGTKEARALADSPFLTSQTRLLLYDGARGTQAREYHGANYVPEESAAEVEAILRARFADSVHWYHYPAYPLWAESV